MHDIKAIRDNPEAYDAAWAKRGLAPQSSAILAIDQRLRSAQTAGQEAQSKRNEASKLIGQAKGRKDEAEAARLMEAVEGYKADLAAAGETEKTEAEALRNLLSSLANLPADDVPLGEDEQGNVEVRRWGDPKDVPAAPLNKPRDHVDLGEGLGMMDFDAAARMSGARFVVLKGQIARLERALGQFMLDMQTDQNGYLEVSPPLLVKDEALYGTGQLPKFAEDLFRTTYDHWLIPTAEVSLTNIVREQIVATEELPLRMTALTPSFRSEAGASGRDTRGMIRQHQFYKVELVSITTPEQSEEEHLRMVGCAEGVLKALGLPFRTMLLCTGDMGFGARKTYDLEVWLPSQNTYREISSCSNCGDFQARRMDARFKAAGEKGTRYVHTLNGSGLAVGRTLVAVLENYQQANGSILIPDALVPYMGGVTQIGGKA
jgi:seryl-tRNA synthetase